MAENSRISWGLVRDEEWRWVLLVAWFVLLLSSLPYIAGYAAQSPEEVFSGAVVDRQDYAVHLSTMHLGERGEWVYRMRFTGELQDGAYIKMAYLFLGHASRWLGSSQPMTYHLARVLFGVVACAAIYGLGAQCFAEVFWRRAAFLVAVLGSGLGWLQLLFGLLPAADISPIDFWLIDGYVFFGILALPHFSAVTALLAAMLLGSLSYLRQPAWWKWVLTTLAAVLVQLIQPYAPVLADFALLGIFIAAWMQRGHIQRHEFFYLLGLGLVQIPLLAYSAFVLNSDPLWRGFVEQNVTLSPPLSYYLWGFGLFWPLAALGAGALVQRLSRTLKETERSAAIPALSGALVWAVAALVLAYSPANLQRRFMHAYTLPLALLAVYGLKETLLHWLVRKQNDRVSRWGSFLTVTLVAVVSLSSLLLSLGTSLNIFQRSSAFFDPAPLVEAIDWLDAHAGPDDLVLSAELSGQLIAARTGMPVYLGHPIETLDYAEKARRVEALVSGYDPGDWLGGNGVRWLVYGPYEQRLGSGINSQAPLVPVYQQDGVVIYRVLP